MLSYRNVGVSRGEACLYNNAYIFRTARRPWTTVWCTRCRRPRSSWAGRPSSASCGLVERRAGVIALVGWAEPARPRSRRASSMSWPGRAAGTARRDCSSGASTRSPTSAFSWSRPTATSRDRESRRRPRAADSAPAARGASTGGPHLLVLDGLERVQREEGQHAGRIRPDRGSPAPRPPDPDRRGGRRDRRPGHQPVPADGPGAVLEPGLPPPRRRGPRRPRPWTCSAATASTATTPRWRGWSSRTGLTR